MTTEALTPNSWGAGFALADAFDLGVELPPALALLLRMDSLGARWLRRFFSTKAL
jgi:hypothetical protein